MNLPIAVPGHVGEDGVWLEFVAPDGKRVLLNIYELLNGLNGDFMCETIHRWEAAQMAAYRAANKG